MKLTWIVALLNCVSITSTPDDGVDGIIHTELGKTVSLTCTHNATSEADSELVWLRNDAVVSLNEGNKKGQSRVCISPVILADKEATFTCHLQSNASDRASVVLNVTYPPSVTDAEVITVEEEATMVLPCDIDAHPPVSSVIWNLNGTEMDLKAGRFILTNDGLTSRLSTDKVQRSLHEGTYECIVDSPLYGSQTNVFTVNVTDKTMKFPLWPMVAGIVVVCLTTLLAVAARWRKIVKPSCLSVNAGLPDFLLLKSKFVFTTSE
uniref:Transmembrane and immunoglobulin domain containing 1 n=1 Tax=Neogobius melanostomus TaxID=47308 RepID=A0A8C6T4K3_9GOBI